DHVQSAATKCLRGFLGACLQTEGDADSQTLGFTDDYRISGDGGDKTVVKTEYVGGFVCQFQPIDVLDAETVENARSIMTCQPQQHIRAVWGMGGMRGVVHAL